MWKKFFLLLSGILLVSGLSVAGNREDTIPLSNHFIHQLGMEVRPAYIIPTNPFLKGYSIQAQRRLFSTSAMHLSFFFLIYRPHLWVIKEWVAYYDFGSQEIRIRYSVFVQGDAWLIFQCIAQLRMEFRLIGGVDSL